MQVTFYGAAGEVTGSSSVIETGNERILIDCGMFQGGAVHEAQNYEPLPFDPKELTHVLVTHAHLDHVGRLPLLTKNGYQGWFYATPPTVALAELIMRDARGVMEHEERKTGKPPLYSGEDIANVMSRFKQLDYENPTVLRSPADVAQGTVTVTMHDAGHIFGSAFIEIQAEGKRVVFSGDVGNVEVPILRDTSALPAEIDLLVCESTYGNRKHESVLARRALIEKLVTEAVSRGGVLMIPSFSLERTQELIYELNDLVARKHKIKNVPIFLDSPLAIDALRVYRQYPKYYDAEAQHLLQIGDDLFRFPGLTFTYSREESKKINSTPGPKIIIAGAGMMNGGRIVHHAMRYLSDERNTLLIIGYQSEGTLGRRILDGESPVLINNERIPVRCRVKATGALSAHGDQDKLVKWIGGSLPVAKKIMLNHGEPRNQVVLAERLKKELGAEVGLVGKGMRIEV